MAGFPAVFAHGMLTMAMTGRLLTDWFGPEAIRRFSARFRDQVWPGDSLTATATVVALTRVEDRTRVDLDLVTENQHHVPVMTGTASVDLAN